MPTVQPTIAFLHEETLLRQAMVELVAKITPYRMVAQVTDIAAFKRAFAVAPPPVFLLMSLACAMADHCANLQWVCINMPQTRVLVTGYTNEPRLVLRTFFAGARGFLSTRQPQEAVCPMLQQLLAGACHFPAEVLAQMRELLPTLEPPPEVDNHHVTPCEREFLRWVVAYGEMTYAQIADAMGKKPRTIEKYRADLFARFSLKGKVGLVYIARELGLHLEPPPVAKKRNRGKS